MAITVLDVVAYKTRGERFSMVTAYDYTMALLVAQAEIPVVLVGDSLSGVMLGYDSTIPATMDEMLHHARAVARGAPAQLLIGDMPFGSYHAEDADAIRNASAFLKAGMHAIKMEGGGRIAPLTQKLTERGIPVMGHLGLTPQFVNSFGGYHVQGKSEIAAARIKDDALALQEAGAFAVVLEGVPRQLAADITGSLTVPTIGIGAGPDCDAQVLVIHDLLGLNQGHVAKFVKQFADLGQTAIDAMREYDREVRTGEFPDDEHSYH